MTPKAALFFAIYALCAVLVTWLSYGWFFERAKLNQQASAEIRLDQAAGRLSGQLQTYRVLINAIARDPRIVAALRDPGSMRSVETTLERQRLTYGAEELDLIAADGTTVASANPNRVKPIPADSPLLRAALNGRLGTDYVTTPTGERFARFSRGVIGPTGRKVGAAVLWVNLEELEHEWPVVPEIIAFADGARLVSANRANLVTLSARALSPDDNSRLTVVRNIPQINLVAVGSFDQRPAFDTARQQALLILSLLGILGLGLFVWLMQRERLAFETATNATLEARVADRTAALRDAQDQLVQASKLTALGQMSAGVSHELNQPLGAILAYAQNGKTLLERGQTQAASENLDAIDGQITRINRIISMLRVFARNEAVPRDPTDLLAAVDAAWTMVRDQAQAANIELIRDTGARRCIVMAGKVRLEQVMLNLFTNAIDAMADQPAGQIHLHIDCDGTTAILQVSDTGPGLADPDRVFEPFYTTKDLGASNGLGLGLALSFGIIASFDGTLSCTNHADGGAIFTITLPVAHEA